MQVPSSIFFFFLFFEVISYHLDTNHTGMFTANSMSLLLLASYREFFPFFLANSAIVLYVCVSVCTSRVSGRTTRREYKSIAAWTERSKLVFALHPRKDEEERGERMRPMGVAGPEKNPMDRKMINWMSSGTSETRSGSVFAGG